MRLILGPPGSGKTHLCLERVRNALRAGRHDCRLIVPTATMAEHLRNELAREGLVFPPAVVSTFTKFVEPFITALSSIPTGALEIIVSQVLRTARLTNYAGVRGFAGFRASIVHAIQEFSSAGGMDKDLAECGVDPDFALVFAAVQAELKRRNWHLRAVQLRHAADVITREEFSGASELLFTGFYSFTGPEIEVVRALAQKTDVTVALVEWAGSEPTVDALRPAVLNSIERIEAVPLPFNRTLCVAPTLDAEVAEIARRIAAAHENGRPWREMGVLVRSERTYVPALRSAFARFGIPSRFYFSSPLKDTPAVQYFRAIVDALLSGWDHVTTLQALRLPGSPIERGTAADEFEFEVLKRVPGMGLDGLAELAPVRIREAIEKLRSLSSWVNDSSYPQAWAGRMRRLRSLFFAQIEDACSHETALLWRSHAAAINAFEMACENAAAALDGATPVDLRSYWDAVNTVLPVSELRVPDHRKDVVHVIDAFEARQWKLPVVFICGLLEKEFPKYQSEDPIIANKVRRRLQARGIQLRTSDERQSDERFLFDLALSRGRDAIVLSYPQLNAKGEANLASFFLQRSKPYVEERAADARPQPLRSRGSEPLPMIVAAPALSRMLDSNSRFSPTGIETYLQCPYQFFAQRTLRLAGPPEKPWERLNALVQGEIVHDVLERSLKEGLAVADLFVNVFNTACATAFVPTGYRTEAIRLELLYNLELIESDQRLLRGEESLFEEPFTFTFENGTLVRGIIDRIEIDRDGNATVIDYKYRSKQSTERLKKGHEEQTSVQGGLYLLAVESMGYRPVGMVYCGIRREVHLTGWLMTQQHVDVKQVCEAAELEAVMATARGDSLLAIEGIRQGRVAPHPADEAKCDYCEFAQACRYEVAAMEQVKKAGS